MDTEIGTQTSAPIFFIIDVRGKAPKARKNTDGGVLRLRLTEGKNPRNKRINKTKP